MRIRRRLALASALKLTGILDLANFSGSRTLTVFGYHRVAPLRKRALFDESVFDAPHAEAFRSQLIWLKNQADPVSERDVLNAILGRTKLPRRAFMITFDDGYRDNYDLAYPILKDLRIPGLFFIPTQAINERKLGWWDIISWCLKHTHQTEFMLHGKYFSLKNGTDKVEAFLKREMKMLPAYQNATLIEDLQRACEVQPPSKEICDSELLTWDQIREMKKGGMGIGSHTHSHRVLATLNLEEQRHELLLSKEILEKELGEKVASIAYPVGGYEHFNTETQVLAQELGYQLGFSYLTGINRVGKLDSLDIHRVGTAQTNVELLAAVAMPQIFGRRRCEAKAPAPYAHLPATELPAPATTVANVITLSNHQRTSLSQES